METGVCKSLLRPFLVAALLFPLRAYAQSAAVSCEPSAAIREVLRNLPESSGTDGRPQRIQALRSLVERYPNDFFVHRSYQDAARYPSAQDQEAMIAEYRGMAQKKLDDPMYAYLAVRALVGVNTKEALPQLGNLGDRVPFAHLSLVQIHLAPNFKDLTKARQHLEAFLKTCPNALEAFRFLLSLEPSEFVRLNTERLRGLLEARSDPESLSHYSTLWSLEFRVRPPNEHERLRKEIAKDLERLRPIDPGKTRSYYAMLEQGYKLLGDTEGAKWTVEQVKSKFPQSAFYMVTQQWRGQNPYPKPNDSAETRKAYYDALAKATSEWVRQWPDEPPAWFDRISALREAPNPDPAKVEGAGNGLLQAIAKKPDSFSFMSMTGASSSSLLVADLYSRKGVRTDEVPELVARGIGELGNPRRGVESDLYPRPESDSRANDFRQWYGWTTIADIWLRVKERDKAREALRQLQTTMEKSKPKVDAKDPEKAATQQRAYMSRQQTYWQKKGELAEMEGHKIDALTFYQNALLARTKKPENEAKDELAEKSRVLWKELGGSNEAWQAWFNRRELFGSLISEVGNLNWTRKDKPLEEFELTDMRGAKWRLADLKGKTTLIGMWATW